MIVIIIVDLCCCPSRVESIPKENDGSYDVKVLVTNKLSLHFRILKLNFGHFPESDTLCAPEKSVYLRKSSLSVMKFAPLSTRDNKNLDCKYTSSNINEPRNQTKESWNDSTLGQRNVTKIAQCLKDISLLPFKSCHGTSFCHLNIKTEVKHSLLRKKCDLYHFNMSTSSLEVEYSCIDRNLFVDDQQSAFVNDRNEVIVKLHETPEIIRIMAFNYRDYNYQDNDNQQELISAGKKNFEPQNSAANSATNLAAISMAESRCNKNLFVVLVNAIILKHLFPRF